MSCSTVLASYDSEFNKISLISEVRISECDLWVGDYPYLNQMEYIRFVDELLPTVNESSSLLISQKK